MYKMFFPSGNAEEFCDHVFRTFDMDKNGYIDFKVIKNNLKRNFFFLANFIQDLVYRFCRRWIITRICIPRYFFLLSVRSCCLMVITSITYAHCIVFSSFLGFFLCLLRVHIYTVWNVLYTYS